MVGCSRIIVAEVQIKSFHFHCKYHFFVLFGKRKIKKGKKKGSDKLQSWTYEVLKIMAQIRSKPKPEKGKG